MKFLNLIILLLSLILPITTIAQELETDNVTQTISPKEIEPFGYNLFSNINSTRQPSVSDPNRTISYGDRILIRMWGAETAETIIMVDADGSIFVPEVGPVQIVGQTLSRAQETIESEISMIYKDNVSVYATLADIKPISVFVTGNINKPGRYEGNQNDTIIDFLLKGGGIKSSSGSYRQITVLRNTFPINNIDLYDFIRKGKLPYIKFMDGDTIVVEEKGPTITVQSGASNSFRFEFIDEPVLGKDLINISKPNDDVSHVRITRKNNLENKTVFQTIKKFQTSDLSSGDTVVYYNDTPKSTISVSVIGATEVESSYEVSKKTHLKELLSYVKIDKDLANLNAIHIERASVAQAQSKSLKNNLINLQKMKLSKQSSTSGEASIRAKEAQMINKLVDMSQDITFEGNVIVIQNGKLNDILLEEGDKIIIPKKSDIVLVNGEVLMPNAFIHREEYIVKDYVYKSGGFNNNADPEKIIIKHPNGNSFVGDLNSKVNPGDEIIVIPKIDEKEFIFAKELISVIYQLAIGTNTLLSI